MKICYIPRSLAALITLAVGPFLLASMQIDEHGWTRIEPSSDSRIVYVSSSEGNDSNDGLSPATPRATLKAANLLIRDGYPDHLLLKRGDVFEEDPLALGRWKSGRSETEPIVLSYYGNDGARPLLKLSNALIHHEGNVRNYVVIIGLDFYKPTSDPSSDEFQNEESRSALNFDGYGEGILVEDCRFRFLSLSFWAHGGSYRNVSIRRNIFTDTWAHDSATTIANTQGLFISGIDGPYLIEENFFDHGGWNESIADAAANGYSHNVSVLDDCAPGMIFRGNISTRGASCGIVANSGGFLERNLFAFNTFTILQGYSASSGGSSEHQNRIWQNVILSGRRMTEGLPNEFQSDMVVGIGVERGPLELVDNIVANRIGDGVNLPLASLGSVEINASENISHRWQAEDVPDPLWPHPNDGLAEFYGAIGGDPATSDAYLQWLRNRPLGTFPWKMTAYAAISYFREGFNKQPLTGYYTYCGQPSTLRPVSGVTVAPDSIALEAGSNATIQARVFPDDASYPIVSWTSSDPTIASVNAYGQVTGRKEGNATVMVMTTEGGYSDSVEISVTGNVAVESVTLKPSLLLLTAGDSQQLAATLNPSLASNQTVFWSSSKKSIAVVDSTGRVVAVSPGTAQITVTTEDGGFTDSLSVRVSPAPVNWAGFARDPSDNVFTGDFLSWVLVRGDWIWVWKLGCYLYLAENLVSLGGAWAYTPLRQPAVHGSEWAFWDSTSEGWISTNSNEGHFLDWLQVSKAPWIYSLSLGHYLYLPESLIQPSGAWVYFTIPN
jgi:hypothetical protein